MLEKSLKYIALWSIGAFMYGIIEIFFKGNTHICMGIVGGICLILIGNINQSFGFDIPLFKQMFYGAIIITSFELATGVLLNMWLNLDVWDYSKLPFNFEGQICLLFSAIWYFLSGFAIIIDDYARFLIFKEPKPYRYYIFRAPRIFKIPKTSQISKA